MGLGSLVDALVPGDGGRLDRLSRVSQAAVGNAAATPVGRPVAKLLHGNEWLGHPAHPVVVVLPIGAWCVTGWFDAKSARSGDPRDEHAADGALRVGIAGALVAASTGLAQYLDTRGAVRREVAVHAALNNLALTLFLASWAARKWGKRPLGRKLSAVGLGIVGVSGYLGGDISYRHGVGVRPQAIRDPARPASETSERPLEASESLHS